jgi:hypothetical protein
MGLEIRENHGHESRKILIFKNKIGGEREREREGFEPDSDPPSDQQVTDLEETPVPDDPLKSP